MFCMQSCSTNLMME
uniref:Uncharacterized protein n=1 Tax=Arundo donax TaxID=35708 RepID=A0A0A8YVJ6_ARUDO